MYMTPKQFIHDFKMPQHKLYMNMELRGLRIDLNRRAELQKKYADLWAEKQDKLNSLIGHPLNVNSPVKVKETLYSELKMPLRQDTSEDTLVALHANALKSDKHREIVDLVLFIRRTRKALGYLEARLDYDGRMRTSYRLTGTTSDRTSTSILEPPVRRYECGWAFQTLTKHGDIGAELREIIIPDEGMAFVEVDQSQAEARVVALLADDYNTLKLFDETDIHKVTTSFVTGIQFDKITKEERQIGKRVRHAGNYKMGKHTFMVDFNTMARRAHLDLRISEWKAKLLLDKFHMMMPKLQGVFHKEVTRILGDTRKLQNPYGLFRMFFGRWDDETIRTAISWIPQSTVGMTTKIAMLRMQEQYPDTQFLMEAHDSFMFQCPNDKVDEMARAAKAAMEVTTEYSHCSIPRDSLKIPADVQVGKNNFKDMKEYKCLPLSAA